MGEENRGSSGSDTSMFVVAILGGLLLLGCCGGLVVLGLVVLGLGGGRFWSRPAPQQFAPVASPPAVQMQMEEMTKELEPLKILPDDQSVPVRGDPGNFGEVPDVLPGLKAPGKDSLPPAPALKETKE